MSQNDHWNIIWANTIISEGPTNFCGKFLSLTSVPQNLTILELACGTGRDTKAFLEQGHTVYAVDFSQQALTTVEEHLSSYVNAGKLHLFHLDLAKDFPVLADVDMVYSHLGLHYFTLTRTTELFRLIFEILKPGGLLGFAVKTVNDQLCGRGEKIEQEPHMYQYKGHVRHFMSEDLVSHYLQPFGEVRLEEVKETTDYGQRTVFHCLAMK